MANTKMTFSLPEPLAATFVRRIRSADRSRYVAEAIAERLEAREREIIAACEAANAEPDVLAATLEFDALPDTMADDPWTGDSIAH